MYVYSNTVARLCNHCCSGKTISITYSEFVCVALCSQHEKRMCRIILSSVVCLALPNFSTYLINGVILEKKLLNIKCVLIFSKTSVRNISLSEKH
jgi:Na+/glutamate symporter